MKQHLNLTSGDLDLLRHLWLYRMATLDHLSRLVDRHRTSISRRLSRLQKTTPRYVHRLQFSSSTSAFYLLTTLGLNRLIEEGIAPADLYDRRNWTHELRPMFLDHLRMVTDIHLLLEEATREPSPVKLATWEQENAVLDRVDVRAPQPDLMGSPLIQRLPVTPDAIFTLENRKDASQRWLYFVEADRSTSNHQRYRKKLLAYSVYHRLQRARARFGSPSFRVLTFTLTPYRARNLATLTRQTLPSSDRRLFYFAALASFDPPNHPHSLFKGKGWLTPRNLTEPTSFLPLGRAITPHM